MARWCAARTVGWARAASLGVGARRASTLGVEGEAVVGANYKMDGADPVLKADDQVQSSSHPTPGRTGGLRTGVSFPAYCAPLPLHTPVLPRFERGNVLCPSISICRARAHGRAGPLTYARCAGAVPGLALGDLDDQARPQPALAEGQGLLAARGQVGALGLCWVRPSFFATPAAGVNRWAHGLCTLFSSQKLHRNNQIQIEKRGK